MKAGKLLSVAQAAVLMKISKSQAQRRLNEINVTLGGRLLVKAGDKRMPNGVRASKFWVHPEVLKEWLTPQLEFDIQAHIELIEEQLRLAIERLEATRRCIRPLLKAHRAEQRKKTS
jgi:hypothetical protein